MTPEQFVDELQHTHFDNVFNPYSDRCTEYDRNDSASRRSSTLLALLVEAAKVELDAIWLGRDFGHRGGRRTGLAFTDDVNLDAHLARWNLKAERPTKGKKFTEQTAKVVWSALNKIEESIFLWNVFPFHPHRTSNKFSNRRHNTREMRGGEDFLRALNEVLCPRRLIAVGNDAAISALRVFSPPLVTKVRHPSYGGAKLFLTQISDLYECQFTST